MKLTPDIRREALDRIINRGQSVRKTCNWLEVTHGVKIGSSALHELVQKARVEAQQTAQACLAESVSSTAGSHGKDLGERLKVSSEIVQQAEKAVKSNLKYSILYQRCVGAYCQLASQWAKVAGLGQPQQSEAMTDLKALLLRAVEGDDDEDTSLESEPNGANQAEE